MLLASRIDDLLDPLLTDDDDESFEFIVEPPLKTTEQLENISCFVADDGEDYKGHLEMMANSPSLTKFTVCEDNGFLCDEWQFPTLGTYLGNNTHLKELTLGYVPVSSTPSRGFVTDWLAIIPSRSSDSLRSRHVRPFLNLMYYPQSRGVRSRRFRLSGG